MEHILLVHVICTGHGWLWRQVTRPCTCGPQWCEKAETSFLELYTAMTSKHLQICTVYIRPPPAADNAWPHFEFINMYCFYCQLQLVSLPSCSGTWIVTSVFERSGNLCSLICVNESYHEMSTSCYIYFGSNLPWYNGWFVSGVWFSAMLTAAVKVISALYSECIQIHESLKI